MKQTQFPQARVDCLSRELGAEVIIYDPEHHVGHCLNSTAAAVWRLCDGKRSQRHIARELSRQYSTRVEERLVRLALAELADARLLEEREAAPDSPTRRVAMRKIGMAAAIALPLITTIVAPTPAQATSCLHNNQPCSSNAQCCSGLCTPLVGRCFGG